jgi:protein involved in polysaccharide export with SLBB domain
MRSSKALLATVGSILVAAAGLSACATNEAIQKLPEATRTIETSPVSGDVEYAMQPGDILSIRFEYHPDHNQKSVVVRTDGKIMLPLVGEVEAAGLTPSELSRQLEKKYSTNLRDPRVAVSIVQVYQNLVWVGGEVKRPGFVPYRPGLTASQALVAVGGPKDTAAIHECLFLQRSGRQQYRSSKLDLSKPIVQGDLSADLALAPQDVIFVPKTPIAKADVWADQHIFKMLPIRFTSTMQPSETDAFNNRAYQPTPEYPQTPSESASESAAQDQKQSKPVPAPPVLKSR